MTLRHAILFAAVWAALALGAVLAPVPARADSVRDELKESIREEREKAKEQESALTRLTVQERRLHGSLASASDELEKLEASVRFQEEQFGRIRADEEAMQERYAGLVRDKKRALRDIQEYLSGMWSFHVQSGLAGLSGEGGGLPTWEKADRQFVWTGEVYRVTQEKMERVRVMQAEAGKALARMQELASEARTQLASVNGQKDAVLERKLDFLKSLSRVRKEKLGKEASLKRVMDAIGNLNYQLSLARDPKDKLFAEFKGVLPWPARGRVVSSFSPTARPPRRGLGLAVEDDAKIRAVGWGKVAHNDVLRGFGRVIIIMHGENYYSLYAFLADSPVKVGAEVRQGEVIGTAGYYPDAEGSGLYFELRFHEKAINPKAWLIALH